MNAFHSMPAVFDGAPLPGSAALQQLVDAVAEGASERDQKRIHPHAAIELLRQSRFGALRLPVAHGGGGATIRQTLAAVVQLGAADSSVAHVLRNHFVFVDRYVVPVPGQEPSPWFEAIAGGAVVGVAAGELTTAAVGDGSIDSQLVADPSGGWRLSGTKFYSTGSLYADYVAVRAQLPDGRAATAVLPVGREGLQLDDDWYGMGQRLTGTGTTRLDHVLVRPDELVIDRDGFGYRIPYSNTIAQLYLTAINAGILLAVQRDAVLLIKRRGNRNFAHGNAPRPEDDAVLQQDIGDIASSAFAAEAIVLAAADALDLVHESRLRGSHDRALALKASVAAAKAKVVVDALVLRAASQLFDVGGASATIQANNLDRHWRNARTLASHNPASQKARVLGEYEIHGTPLPSGGFF